LPEWFGLEALGNMLVGQRRYIAYTFNKDTDTTCAYIDGVEFKCEEHPLGTVGKVDCNLNGDGSYISLGHRMPGRALPYRPP